MVDARHAEDVQGNSGAFSPHHESPGCNVSSSSMCAEEVRYTLASWKSCTMVLHVAHIILLCTSGPCCSIPGGSLHRPSEDAHQHSCPSRQSHVS